MRISQTGPSTFSWSTQKESNNTTQNIQQLRLYFLEDKRIPGYLGCGFVPTKRKPKTCPLDHLRTAAGDVPKTGAKTKESKLGIQTGKDEDFGKWYSTVCIEAELISYYPVSGCYILRPWAFAMWEVVQGWFDAKIKSIGVENCMFPLFITEDVLRKEADHIEVRCRPACALGNQLFPGPKKLAGFVTSLLGWWPFEHCMCPLFITEDLLRMWAGHIAVAAALLLHPKPSCVHTRKPAVVTLENQLVFVTLLLHWVVIEYCMCTLFITEDLL